MYDQRYYLLNRSRILATMKARGQAIREMLRIARQVPCAQCRQKLDWWKMEFDHQESKMVNVAEMVRHPTSWPDYKILAELAKCEVVCVGCHRDRSQALAQRGSPVQFPSVDQIPGSRICNRCEKGLDDSEFYVSRGRPRPTCKRCWTRVVCESVKVRNRAIVRQFKTNPCADCGATFPYWKMDFDHLPGTSKTATIARLSSTVVSKKRLLAEIAKCEVVCCFCHKDRTYFRSLETA